MDLNLARISILDTDPTVRAELSALVLAAGWRSQCFNSAMEFLAEPRTLTPGCLILDVALPDLTGLELQKRLAPRTELPIIFCTSHRDVSTSVQAMKAGAFEFLIKPICGQIMMQAIEYALHRSTIAVGKELNLRALQARHALLSAREREVMALVVAGRLNKLIAADLEISEITVKVHRGRVMRKMKARSVPDLVTMAAQLATGFEQHGPARPQRALFDHTPTSSYANDVRRPLEMIYGSI